MLGARVQGDLIVGAGSVTIDVCARFDAVDSIAERPGRAVAHGANNFVHPATARGGKRLLVQPEHVRKPVRTES